MYADDHTGAVDADGDEVTWRHLRMDAQVSRMTRLVGLQPEATCHGLRATSGRCHMILVLGQEDAEPPGFVA